MKYSETFHFRWVQEYDKKTDTVINSVYRLGKSNKTSKSKGGVTVCVFLAKDGVLTTNEQEANQLLWVVLRCSEVENYNKKKAREMAQYKISSPKRNNVLVSDNFTYDIVRQVALHLGDVTESLYHELNAAGAYKKNRIWEELKTRVNVQALATSLSAPVVDKVVQADVLHSRTM